MNEIKKKTIALYRNVCNVLSLNFNVLCMASLIFLYASIVALAIPTMYGDNAFYMGRISSYENFSFIKNIQLQGLLEYIIYTISGDGRIFIPLYKLFVILINFTLFTFAFYSSGNKLFIIFAFSVAQFYLAPSMFSYSVAGFSLIFLSSKCNSILPSVLYFIIALFFVSYELPNPKYLILGFLLFLFYSYNYNTLKDYKLLFKNITLISIFLLLMIFLLLSFINTNGKITLNYVVLNTELLDLVGRGFVSAITPYKQNRFLAYLYVCIFLYLLITLTINIKNFPKLKILITLLFLLFSFGILEPTGIINYFVFNYGIFGFLRTRAGFDLFLFFILMGFYSQFENIKNKSYYYFSICIFSVVLLIESPRMYLDGLNNFSNIQLQGGFLNFIDDLDSVKGKKCFISNADYYADNSIFSFGPPIFKLTTNYFHFRYSETELSDLKNKCDFVIFDTNEVNFHTIVKYFNNKIIFRFNTFIVL